MGLKITKKRKRVTPVPSTEQATTTRRRKTIMDIAKKEDKATTIKRRKKILAKDEKRRKKILAKNDELQDPFLGYLVKEAIQKYQAARFKNPRKP
mgnify:CR=1 FL=1